MPLNHTILALTLATLLAACASNPALLEPSEPVEAAQYRQEVSRLKANAGVQRALAHAETFDAGSESLLIKLNEIPAPPFAEEARARRFAELLREAGLSDVSIDEVGNVIARRKG